VTHNTEHVFGLLLPSGAGAAEPARAPGPPVAALADAAARCFSPSNAEAILQLPLRAAA
jgi:dATP pyrophosphohydrolase